MDGCSTITFTMHHNIVVIINGKVAEPAEAPADVTVEDEISATGPEDAAPVLSSQATRKLAHVPA